MVQEEALIPGMVARSNTITVDSFEKMPLTRSSERRYLVRLRSRTMVERGKNNPAIVMWSIGNEVGEADGSDKSVANVRRLVKTIMTWMQPAMSPWE